MLYAIWYALHFKKREKHPWRCVTFSKVADFSFAKTSVSALLKGIIVDVTMVPNRAKCPILSGLHFEWINWHALNLKEFKFEAWRYKNEVNI